MRTWHVGAPGSSLSQRCLCVSCVEFGVWVRHYPGLYHLYQMGTFYLLEMSFFNTGWRKPLLTSWGFVTVCNTCTQTPGTALDCANVPQMFCSHCRGHRRRNNAGAKDPVTQSWAFALSHEPLSVHARVLSLPGPLPTVVRQMLSPRPFYPDEQGL